MPKLIMKRYKEEEVENLGFSICFTNSELTSMSCKRQYAFEYVECIEHSSFSPSMFFGTCWHYMCERVLEYYKEYDAKPSKDYIDNLLCFDLPKFISEELNKYDKYFETSDRTKSSILHEVHDNCSIGFVGWYDKLNKEIIPKYEVIGVEEIIFDKVKTLDGRDLELDTALVKSTFDDGTIIYRLPLMGEEFGDDETFSESPIVLGDYESSQAIKHEWDYKSLKAYKIGKLDCVLRERGTNKIYILDHKTSGTPKSYMRNMMFDLQLDYYASILDNQVKQLDPNLYVAGVIWDIASSKYYDVSLDDDGLMKQVKRAYPTYALANLELQKSKYDSIRSAYDKFLETCKEKDESNYILCERTLMPNDFKRMEYETISNVWEAYKIKRTAFQLNFNNEHEFDMELPRTSICKVYKFCKFFRSCQNCSTPQDPNLVSLKRTPKVYWVE